MTLDTIPPPKMKRLSPVKPPALPRLTPTGAYRAEDLDAYLRAANRAGMLDFEIARHLRVPLHRLIFWQREGRR